MPRLPADGDLRPRAYARFAIDDGASERAIRPLAIGRANWLQIGGDGGLTTAAVLLSVCASATRHRLNPWSYVRDVLDQLAARSADADASDLLPDAWAIRHAQIS
jgi:transposase